MRQPPYPSDQHPLPHNAGVYKVALPPPPLGGNRIKLLGKEIKGGRREGEGKREGKKRRREGKEGREEGIGR